MHVAVAIVGFRNLGDIVRCLGALEHSSHTDFEVIICENGGPEAFATLRQALAPRMAGGQPVKVVPAPRNLGYGGGVNTCFRAAVDADAWWVLNPDTQSDPAAMAALVERLSVGDCAAVGGVIYFPDGGVESYGGGHWNGWLARSSSIGWGRASGEPVDADEVERALSYLSGASMMISRHFLQTVGPMREDYFLYCEEVEWFLRARALGLRLGFASGARVTHHQGTTTGSVADLRRRPRLPVYLDARNKILVTRDRFPRRLSLAAIPSLAFMLARCVRRGAWRQFGYSLSGWLAGLGDERGIPEWLEA